MSLRSNFPRTARSLLFACWLQSLLPRPTRGDGTASYKFQSWQEAAGRIHVDSQAGQLEQGLPDDVRLKLTGVVDTITGATPTGQLTPDATGNIPRSEIEDRRKAWTIDATKSIAKTALDLGFANSRESDYISNGFSINSVTDFNQKNTSLLAGVGVTDDKVKVFFQNPWEKKRGVDTMIGLNQLIDPDTSVAVNVSLNRSTGYLSDPYKLIEKHIDLGENLSLLSTFGENRPDARNAWTVYARINRNLRGANAAIEGSYRFYHDSFGVNGHTFTLEWFQRCLSDRLIISPLFRYYEQSAADFYRTTLDGTGIDPSPQPNPDGPFYSADYRLSKMRTLSYGLKCTVIIVPQRCSIDLSYDRYTMAGLDHITPSAEYADANVFTVGALVSW